MEVSKQERSVIHLELNGEHHYFGSVKALCDNFGKEQIGIGYKSLANYGITAEKPYRNKYCTVRKGVLITAPKTEQTRKFANLLINNNTNIEYNYKRLR